MARFKLKDEHIAMLAVVLATLTPNDMTAIQTRIVSDGKFKDALMRLRWDCFYAGFNKSSSIAVPAFGTTTPLVRTIFFNEVYIYATDCHIDTVLKYLLSKQFGDSYNNFTGDKIC